MGGADALAGLIYQQRYVMFRLLEALSLQMTGTRSARRLVSFQIEGQTHDDAPVWDVILEFTDRASDCIECKNTSITKQDRKQFYKRWRSQLAGGLSPEEICPAFVSNPDKQTTNILDHLDGIESIISKDIVTIVPSSAPRQVDSSQDAVAEAYYYLCVHSEAGWPPPCAASTARVLLQNLKVRRHGLDELDRRIELLANGALSVGTGHAVKECVTGFLTDLIVHGGRIAMTLEKFLKASKTSLVEADVRGRVRHLLTYSAGRTSIQPRLVRWSRLANEPITEWTIGERLQGFTLSASLLIEAEMGLGKSTSCRQAFADARRFFHPSHVLLLEARTLDGQDLAALVQLVSILAGIGATWVAIDGLDEISSILQLDWERNFKAISTLPGVTILASVRREVFATQHWLVELLADLSRTRLLSLTESQVKDAFQGVGLVVPINIRLISALRNPFLLSLYADIVTPDDRPLAQSGEVTGFGVINEFWKRRVHGPSIGQRLIGESALSSSAKRRAVAFLSRQSLDGALNLRRDASDDSVLRGIEMLVYEGVVREQSSNSVAWVHEWLREYAVVDQLVSELDVVSTETLAARVASLSEDHVARVAAAGAVKWLLTNPSFGSPSGFLRQLWSLNRGLGREVLVVLLEGSAADLSLRELSVDVLSEAITMIVQLRAAQWSTQISELDENIFLWPNTEQLHADVIEFELSVSDRTATSDLFRLIRRDIARFRNSLPRRVRTVYALLDRVSTDRVYSAPDVVEWLVGIGSLTGPHQTHRLLQVAKLMISAGDSRAAFSVVESALKHGHRQHFLELAKAIVERKALIENELFAILGTPGLVGQNPDTWARLLIELLGQAVKLNLKQWASFRLNLSNGKKRESPASARRKRRSHYDDNPQFTTLRHNRQDSTLARLTLALGNGLRDACLNDDSASFDDISRNCMSARYSGIIALSLLAIYDALQEGVPPKPWLLIRASQILKNRRVLRRQNLSGLRRLLRRRAALHLTESESEMMADAIRRFARPKGHAIHELSDLREHINLLPDELAELEALSADALWEPIDPRLLVVTASSSWTPERAPSSSGWPRSDDEELVSLLNSMPNLPPRDKSPTYLESELRYLDALRVILSREEATSPEWLGTVLGWCHYAANRILHRIHIRLRDESRPFDGAVWLLEIDSRAPWWRRFAEMALHRLEGEVPEHHSQIDKNAEGYWGAGDPIASALRFLDVVMTTPAEPPFDNLHSQLARALVNCWRSWPNFTRGLAIITLERDLWQASQSLRNLLAEAIRNSESPYVVNAAAQTIAPMCTTTFVPELDVLMERVIAGEHLTEAMFSIADCLVWGWIKLAIDPADQFANRVKLSLLSICERQWKDGHDKQRFLSGVLDAAGQHVIATKNVSDEMAATWIALVDKVIERLPTEPDDDREIAVFSIRSVERVFQASWPVNVKREIFIEFLRTTKFVLRKGSLGEYCDTICLLNTALGGENDRGETSLADMFPLDSKSEAELIELCQVAIRRAIDWRRTSKQSSDLAWGGGPSGSDAVALTISVLRALSLKDRAKRELVPVCDEFANAGFSEKATELRLFMKSI